MSECFITRRGGGTSKVFAVIGVSYPEGSTCTCTDGTKTLKLKDTSGQGIFLIPYAATWTVMCYDGADYGSSENKKSENVEITTEGQIENIVLNYQLVLFDSTTSPSSAFSGSFSTKAIPLSSSFGDYTGAPSASYSNDGYVLLSQAHHQCGFWYYSKDGGLIDLSNYSTVNCTIAGFDGDGNKFLAVRDSLDGYSNTNNIATKTIATGTISVPINTSASAYIGIMLYHVVTVRLTKLWLE